MDTDNQNDDIIAWDFETEDWSDFSLDSYEFFFYQAEEMLKAGEIATTSLRSRAIRFLSFNIPLSIAIFGYVVTNILSLLHSVPLTIVLVVLTFSNFKFLKILKAKHVYSVGSSPRDLITQEWLDYSGDEQKKAILFNECKQYEFRITHKLKLNHEMGRLLNEGISAIIYSTVIAFLIFMAIAAFNNRDLLLTVNFS